MKEEILMDNILTRAKDIQGKILEHRRYLHTIPEIGMDLPQTKAYVFEKLKEMGYEPVEMGGGIVVTVGKARTGKTFLIRGDMDALQIREESGLDFASTNGNCHACGHDTHTAMLLGAAQILKDIEGEIEGCVKLMFQPGEETLEGAKSMIEAGVLENPRVDAAMSLHIFSGFPLENGSISIGAPGPALAGNATVHINVEGVGCHGAMPQQGVDTINVLAKIHGGLQSLIAREFSPFSPVSLTFGSIHAGDAPNVIPDRGYMTGTLRIYSNDDKEFALRRIKEISEGIASAYRAKVRVEFPYGAEVTVNDEAVTNQAVEYLSQIFGQGELISNSSIFPLSGSEDFSFIAQKVPSVIAALSGGLEKDGIEYPMHHPKVIFDEKYLYRGTAAYVQVATKWLENNY